MSCKPTNAFHVCLQDHPVQPALVVVFFGANDASFPMPSGKGQHVPLQEFKENLKNIALYLKVTILMILFDLACVYKFVTMYTL